MKYSLSGQSLLVNIIHRCSQYEKVSENLATFPNICEGVVAHPAGKSVDYEPGTEYVKSPNILVYGTGSLAFYLDYDARYVPVFQSLSVHL